MSTASRLAELEAAARYAGDRYRLYRARMYGGRAADPGRLRELEREAALAKRLLAQFKADHPDDTS